MCWILLHTHSWKRSEYSLKNIIIITWFEDRVTESNKGWAVDGERKGKKKEREIVKWIDVVKRLQFASSTVLYTLCYIAVLATTAKQSDYDEIPADTECIVCGCKSNLKSLWNV